MSDVLEQLHALLSSRPVPEHVAQLLVEAGVDRSVGSAGHGEARREQEEQYRDRERARRQAVLMRLERNRPDVVARARECLQVRAAGGDLAQTVAALTGVVGQVDGWELGFTSYHDAAQFEDLPPAGKAERLVDHVAELTSMQVDVPDWVVDLPPTLGELADGYASRRGYLERYEQFATHPGLERPYASALAALEAAGFDVRQADPADAGSLRRFVTDAWQVLGVDDARQERVRSGARFRSASWRRSSRGARGDKRGSVDVRMLPSASEIRVLHPGVSVSAWRRAAKALAHLDARTGVLESFQATQRSARFGKSRLAADISLEDLSADLPTAAFVAYYASRLAGRTLFTVGEQARPMDTVAQELFDRARASQTYRPDVVARVYTAPAVLRDLSEAQLGELLGRYYEVMSDAAAQLESLWDASRSRTSMVVRRGEDSSAWNMASRAFNQARTGWLNLMGVAGLAEQAASRLPGKVPALVAGDVAYLHELAVTAQSDPLTGAQHADIAVWASLPLPWEVLDGRAVCTADDVASACAAVGVDAAQAGWTQPYRQDATAAASVTPALVHGVQVSSDALASWLKDAGVFSGYQVRLRSAAPSSAPSVSI